MKRFPILFVAALMMAAVSAPAQRRGEPRGERNVRGGIVSSHQHVGATQRGPQRVTSRYANSNTRTIARRGVQRGHARGYNRGIRSVGPFGTTGSCAPLRPAGYYRTVSEPVLIEAGHWHRVHVPAVYGWVYDSCGHRVWGIVEPACYRREWHAPRYEQRTRRIWVRY